MSTISGRPFKAFLLISTLAFAAPILAQQPRMVSPDVLSHYWILLNSNVDIDLPNSGVNLYKPGCVAVSYVIGSNGIPQNVRVAKTVPASDLGKAAVSAVSRFRYGPYVNVSRGVTPETAHDNRGEAPVSTYYIVPFNSPTDAAQAKAVADACRLPGYDQA